MADNFITGSPVIVAKVVTGIPSAPKATGVVSKIKVYVKASKGSKLCTRNEIKSERLDYTGKHFWICM